MNYSCVELGTDFGSLTGLEDCIEIPNQRFSCRPASVFVTFDYCEERSCVRKYHLLAALQFVASPASMIS